MLLLSGSANRALSEEVAEHLGQPLCQVTIRRFADGELFVNADEPFPMASTYKVPIAVQLLTRVDSGTVRLDSMIALKPSDLHPGSGTLTTLWTSQMRSD